MSKFSYPRILRGLVWISILAACAQPIDQVPTPAAVSPTSTETATLPPTEPLPSPTSTLEYAPVCDAQATSIPTPAACQIPVAEQSTVFCTNKVPYNLILINADATYRVLSEGFTCTDAGMKDSKKLVTCTGKMASAFQLSVCDPACAIPTVQAEITQCPQGFNYDNQRSCCTQGPQPSGQNCMVLSFTIGSCAIDCSEFTEEADCNKNAYACQWDDNNNECQVRR